MRDRSGIALPTHQHIATHIHIQCGKCTESSTQNNQKPFKTVGKPYELRGKAPSDIKKKIAAKNKKCS